LLFGHRPPHRATAARERFGTTPGVAPVGLALHRIHTAGRGLRMARGDASVAAALEQVPLLAELSKRDRGRLVHEMKERTFPAGKRVVVEGKGGVGFFIIVEGRAAVTIGGEVVHMLGPGDHFGELALLDNDVRTATVVADTELRCLTVNAWSFKPFVQNHPTIAWALLQTLARRARETAAR
jgi:CRP/FNR family cyclic AMP-dependent transcriptional regulator